jgi:phospholipid-binding lipoprotein MlaA
VIALPTALLLAATPLVQVAPPPAPPVTAAPVTAPPVTAPPVTAAPDAPGQAAPLPAPTPDPVPATPVQPAPSPVAETAAPQGRDITVRGRARWEAPDPLSKVNEQSFAATQKVDSAVVGPVARTYKRKVPRPIRDGVHNFLYNLREPVVFLNFLLQHKIGKAAATVGRFGINSTIGALGLFDFAKRRPFKLPRRSNGFANTLGFYGVPNGPFMFLPLVGPTTVRDLFGGAIDRLVLPATLGSRVTDLKFAIPVGVLSTLDHRAEFDDTLQQLHDAKGDPYARSRDFYLQRRQAEIDRLHGRDTGTVGGMSAAPTGPITVRPRSDAAPVDPPVDPGAEPAPVVAPTPAPTPVPPPPAATPPAADTSAAVPAPAASPLP